MQLLSIPPTTFLLDDACMSAAGLVDRQTAAATCDVLWTDASPAAWLDDGPATSALGCPVCASDHGTI